MNALHALLPFRIALPPAQRNLLLCAAVVAVSILSLYVSLLHEAVARGDELHRTFASRVPAKASLPRAQAASAQPRNATITADASTR